MKKGIIHSINKFSYLILWNCIWISCTEVYSLFIRIPTWIPWSFSDSLPEYPNPVTISIIEPTNPRPWLATKPSSSLNNDFQMLNRRISWSSITSPPACMIYVPWCNSWLNNRPTPHHKRDTEYTPITKSGSERLILI